MSNRPATITQVEIRRAIKAAKREGIPYIDVTENGHTQRVSTEEGNSEYVNGFVYFIACGPWVKIGFAADVDERLSGLQGGNPEELTVLHILPGNQGTEREFHKRFAAYRHRREWFRREGELAKWLEAETREIVL